MLRKLSPLFLLFLFLACGTDGGYETPDGALFESLDADDTGVTFTNTVEDGEDFNVLSYRNFYNGAGVGIGDLDGDGQNDLYFAANQGPNQLFLNQGKLAFKVVQNGAAAGAMAWSTGVTLIDINRDGKLDIYVCNSGEVNGSRRANELFINQGNDTNGEPTFEDQAPRYGLDDPGFGTQAAWFDYDRDGDLDVYLLNNSYLSAESIDPRGNNREKRDAVGGDKFFRNDGDKFTDVSDEVGIFGSRIGFGLGVGLGDFNNDGWTDFYVSNDFWERDYLYINGQDGTFSEELIDRVDHVSISSMGSDVGDLDNDGDVEIFSTDMLAADNARLKASTLFDSYTSEAIKYEADYHHQILQNCLQVNNGKGEFTEVAHYSGVGATDWSWGALIMDMNNDGLKDIFVANGIYRDIMNLDFADFLADREQVRKMVEEKGRYDWRDFVDQLPHNAQANYAFVNQGQLRFDNKATELGLGAPTYSNGAAYGDLDGDGDLELVVNNVNQEALVYQNTSREQGANFLGIRLTGSEANQAGIGARVEIRSGEQIQVLEQYPSRGFLSSVGPELVFGLGEKEMVETVTVTWPDGSQARLNGVKANQYITLDHAEATSADLLPVVAKTTAPLLRSAREILDRPAVHIESFHNDFNHESLLLRKLSDPGPDIVKGDPNGDGLEDFIVLGGINDPDKLYHQRPDGTFEFVENSFLAMTANYESSCGAFFDIDGDGDEDLMLGTGGNEFSRGFQAYPIRVYENIRGQLVSNHILAPPAGGEVSCIKPADIDLDGDMDLFIGCRGVPGNYGLIPGSFLFIRQGGNWVRQTPKDIGGAGMVTDAEWMDLNGDGRPDLVMVGDWMPITVAFTLDNAEISQAFEIPNSSGWWTGLEAADLDGDGLEDLVATNWGLNSKFRASPERPLELHVKDFDNNQKSEFIVEWYPPGDKGEKTFFASKRELHGQLPSLRKKTLKYEDFARASYETLFTEEQREGTQDWDAKELRSMVIWNKKDGNVRLEPLPWQAQLTPQFATAIEDVNADGKPDIWLGGNIYGLSPQVGRADAGRGTLLLNRGDRVFEYVDNEAAGISIRGQVRSATFLNLADGRKSLLVGCNDDPLEIYVTGESLSKK